MKRVLAPLAIVALPLIVGALTMSAAPAAAHPATPFAADGKAMFEQFKCSTCHSIASQGITAKMTNEKMKGPDLSDVGNKHDAAWLTGWLQQQTEKDGKKHKMKFSGTPDELKQLIDWLLTLKKA